MKASSERNKDPVVAVATHRNLDGLRTLVPAMLHQTAPLDIELIIVDSASQNGTREWLSQVEGPITVLRLPHNKGPGSAFNAVFESRPKADSYVFFDDDTVLRGNEVPKLLESLRSDKRLGIVAGEAVTQTGNRLASSYTRRPLRKAFPLLWDRWWGPDQALENDRLEYVDVVGGSGMAIRGELARQIGIFETILWPAAFEDLDYCARAKFCGWAIAIDHGTPIYQEVSVTTNKVFGREYPALRRSSGVMYSALNYPVVIAIGRVLEAGVRAIVSSAGTIGRGDAWGLLRCARSWRVLLRGRRVRRRLRQRRTARAW